MSVLLWIFIGLLAGAAASAMSRESQSRFAVDVAIGLVASIVGGILSIFLR